MNLTSKTRFLPYLLYRILNVHVSELSRVGISWFLTFFARVGFVVGWIALTAMFVARYGIAFLPTLYIMNAIGMMIGSLFYSKIIASAKKELIIVLTVLAAGILLFIASFYAQEHSLIFFSLLIVSHSIFSTQLFIVLSALIEKLFSPLEGERLFPLIESAETIGAIVAGVAIGLFINRYAVHQLIFVWTLALMILIPFVLYHHRSQQKAYSLFHMYAPETPAVSILPGKKGNFEKSIEAMKRIPFLKGLFILVLTQWIFFNMLEFQYTKAVEQHVVNQREETLVYKGDQNRIFHVSLLTDPHGATAQEELFPGLKNETLTPPQEKSLTKLLGSLHMLFGGVALLAQLFFASHFLRTFGILRTLLLHPILLLLTFLGVFFKFGFLSSVIMRSSFEIGNVLYKNAYHTSYYAFRHALREPIREFMEGFARPMGILIGMTALLLFHFVLQGKSLTLGINVMMGITLVVMLIKALDIRRHYIALPEETLFSQEDEKEKLNAIEILGQEGNSKGINILINASRHYADHDLLLTKILTTLGKSQDVQALSIILEAVDDARPNIRLVAIRSLMLFDRLGKIFYSQAFSRHRLNTVLKARFWNEDSEENREAILHVFSRLGEPDVVDFLLDVLEKGDPILKAHCIKACARFQDPALLHYLLPYLQFPHPHVQASVVHVLWQFPSHRSVAEQALQKLSENTEKESTLAFLRALRDIPDENRRHALLFHMRSEDPDVAFEAALSLAQNGNLKGLSYLAANYLQFDSEKIRAFQFFYRRLPSALQKKLQLFFESFLNSHFIQSPSAAQWEHILRLYELFEMTDAVFEARRILSALQDNHTAEPSQTSFSLVQ